MNTGYRRTSAAVLSARAQARGVHKDEGIDRPKLSSAARTAASALSLPSSARQVLGELAGCWGGLALARGMMVWPSNEFLVERTGLSERSVRFALRRLIDDRLIAPHDSANGKRFAVRAHDGTIIDAYGFDLAPLASRLGELEGIMLDRRRQEADRDARFEEITIARRVVADILEQIEDVELGRRFATLCQETPRRASKRDPNEVLAAWVELRRDAESAVETTEPTISEFDSGRGGDRFRHIESNNDASTDSCQSGIRNGERRSVVDPRFLASCCPVLGDFGLEVTNIRELVEAGRSLRPAIGAHPSAWIEAIEEIGDAAAAAMVVWVAQLHADDVAGGRHRIKNPGGLFRSLVRRHATGAFDLAMELRRRQ